MKPYYKEGGFFDRLERLSDWIDNQIYRPFGIRHLSEEMRICSYWINRLANAKTTKSISRECLRIEMRALAVRLKEYIELYNREKYWWMREK